MTVCVFFYSLYFFHLFSKDEKAHPRMKQKNVFCGTIMNVILVKFHVPRTLDMLHCCSYPA